MRKIFFCLPLIGVVAGAHAQVLSNDVEAFDNATVQPAGPRIGANGKNFFNIEGSSFDAFASYGVADFDGSSVTFAEPILGLTNVTLSFTQSNAGFTANGNLRFWVTGDTGVDIQPGTSSLVFDAGHLPSGVNPSAFSSLHDLGTGSFVQVANGHVDSYTFALSGDAKALLEDSLANGSALRFLITPDDAGVAATWAGFSHNTFAGPTVSFEAEAVPEPATLTLIGLGALAALRRKKSA